VPALTLIIVARPGLVGHGNKRSQSEDDASPHVSEVFSDIDSDSDSHTNLDLDSEGLDSNNNSPDHGSFNNKS
jgi:hypothetical protein